MVSNNASIWMARKTFDSFDTHKTQTSQDGRFTVVVADKYLPDPSPLRQLDVRVTIDHPRYVTYWNTADTQQITKEASRLRSRVPSREAPARAEAYRPAARRRR